MAELYDMTTSTSITPIVESCEMNQELNQVVTYSTAGTMYMQIIGQPRKSYSVVCYATRTQVVSIETAWSSGNLIRITMTGGTYYGYVIEFSKNPVFEQNNLAFDGTAYNEYYKVELKLAYAAQPVGNSQQTEEQNSTP